MLVHEMTHFYLGAKTLGLTTVPREEYELTSCVRLDQGLSLRNPQNYQALVAMVEQGCVDAPNPFWDLGDGRVRVTGNEEVGGGNWSVVMSERFSKEGSDAAGAAERYDLTRT